MSLLLIMAIGFAVLYLVCDAIQKYAAVQELARLAFAVSLLAWCIGVAR